MTSTITSEDNVTCIAQFKEGHIKGGKTKHILPKVFFTFGLQKNDDINVQQVCLHENLEDFFYKVITKKNF